eukprot:17288-Heterococcus_DN1.PRE.2
MLIHCAKCCSSLPLCPCLRTATAATATATAVTATTAASQAVVCVSAVLCPGCARAPVGPDIVRAAAVVQPAAGILLT